MRFVLAALSLLTLAATDGGPQRAAAPVQAGGLDPGLPSTEGELRSGMPVFGQVDHERCRTVINRVRGERGLPLLRREAADAAPVTLTAAVDLRIEGCPVMVPLNNPENIRPFPQIEDDPRLRPVPAGGR